MKKVNLFVGKKKIPFIHHQVDVSTEGVLTDFNGEIISLETFNLITGLDITDVAILVAVTFHSFNWPPIYWNKLNILRHRPESISPENLVISLKNPVESLEYPGFYMIPYFTNYVVSRSGVLIKKSAGIQITASRGPLGYYTYRMSDDSGSTQNKLRHRILCYTFKEYDVRVDELDVNHIDGVPGNDDLENLEWATRQENMNHAYSIGLRSDNKDVEIRDVNTGNVHIFPSCSEAGRVLGVTETTISNRCKSNGYKLYSGMQFRFYPSTEPWPVVESKGNFLVEFSDGTSKVCNGVEAARLAGLTRTSLLRALRSGRNQGSTDVKISRVQ